MSRSVHEQKTPTPQKKMEKRGVGGQTQLLLHMPGKCASSYTCILLHIDSPFASVLVATSNDSATATGGNGCKPFFATCLIAMEHVTHLSTEGTSLRYVPHCHRSPSLEKRRGNETVTCEGAGVLKVRGNGISKFLNRKVARVKTGPFLQREGFGEMMESSRHPPSPYLLSRLGSSLLPNIPGPHPHIPSVPGMCSNDSLSSPPSAPGIHSNNSLSPISRFPQPQVYTAPGIYSKRLSTPHPRIPLATGIHSSDFSLLPRYQQKQAQQACQSEITTFKG